MSRIGNLGQSLQQSGQHAAIDAELFFRRFLSRSLFFFDRPPFTFSIPDRGLRLRLKTFGCLTFAQLAPGFSAGLLVTLQLFSPSLLTVELLHRSSPVETIESPPLTDTRRSPAARRDGDCDGPSVLRLASPPGESSWRPGSKFPGNVPPPRKSPATPAHIRSAAASRHEFARPPTTTLCWLNFWFASKGIKGNACLLQ